VGGIREKAVLRFSIKPGGEGGNQLRMKNVDRKPSTNSKEEGVVQRRKKRSWNYLPSFYRRRQSTVQRDDNAKTNCTRCPGASKLQNAEMQVFWVQQWAGFID